MNERPEVFLYEYRAPVHCLYLGGLDTVAGLRLCDPAAIVEVKSFFADKPMPSFPKQMTVNRLSQILSEDGQVGLFEFSCQIETGIGLSTHDDNECHFQFESLELCKRSLEHSFKDEVPNAVWQYAVKHEGKYVVFNHEGDVETYRNFDTYLANKHEPNKK